MPTTTTPNIGLGKFTDGDLNWGATIDANFDAIDSHIGALIQSPLGPAATVTYSAIPNFDLSQSTAQHILLNGDVSSFTFSGARDGQIYVFVIEQDSSGGHAFNFPSTFKNAGTINSTTQDVAPNSVATQSFIYLSSRAAFFATSPLYYA